MKTRIGLLAFSVILLGITSLAAIPFMIRGSGLEAWAAIAVGQTIGSICFIVLLWGWGVTGPALVAAADDASRRIAYFDSLRARACLTIPVFLAGGIACFLSSPDDIDLALLGLLSTALLGLCGNWYFNGTGQAAHLLLLETIPRVAGTVIGTTWMAVSGLGAHVALSGMVGGALAAIAFESAYVAAKVGRGLPIVGGHGALGSLIQQRPAAAIGLTGAIYASAPVLIVAHVNPAALPVFAILDKIQKQVVTATGPVFNALQGWVPKVASQVRSRARRAAGLSSLAAMGLFVVFSIVGVPIISLISDSSFEVSWGQAVAVALASSLYFLDAVVSRAALIPLGRITSVYRSTIVCTVVGLALTTGGAVAGDATSAMLGFSAGLALKLTWSLIVLTRVEDTNGKSRLTISE